MLHDLSIVVGQVVTLFLLMSVGFVLAKTGWFSEKTISQMSHLLFYCVSPCIIIERLQIDGDVTFLISLGEAFLCMASYYVMFLIIAQFLFRRQPEDKRVVYRFGTVFGNNSYMGLPLLEGVLGPSSVIYGVVAIITFNVFQWTVGVRMMGGKMSLKKCFINPGILSLAAFAAANAARPFGSSGQFRADPPAGRTGRECRRPMPGSSRYGRHRPPAGWGA